MSAALPAATGTRTLAGDTCSARNFSATQASWLVVAGAEEVGMVDEVPAGVEARIRRRQTIRLGVLAAIVAVFVALAADNRASVTLGYVVGERRAPLVVALVVAFVLGAVTAWLLSLRHRGRGSE
jgi:uncharacterized integral membrane protein